VSSMVVSVHRKALGGKRVGNMVVPAEVLTHAMDEHDNARTRLAVVSGPAIAGELRAVRGTVREPLGSGHSTNIKMVRPKQSSLPRAAIGACTANQPDND
jgi:hypothetical protein